MDTTPIHLLRHLLLTLAFCLAIAAIQQFFMPSVRFQVHLVYSVATGVSIWVVVDFGRLWLTRASDGNWPLGFRGLALVASAIPIGYLVGSFTGDWWFGWSSWANGRDQIVSGALVTLLGGTVASSYFYLRGRSLALQAQAEAAKAQAAESRLKLLQSQLDPHMLFNSLANLRSLIASDPERATAMLDRLNDFLRSTLSASRATLHPLAAEFDRLRDYLELMAVRMGPRLAFTLDLPRELTAVPVPTLLLQPLVENSIRHGLEPSVPGGSVSVRAWLDGDGALQLEVADSGTGLQQAMPVHSGGFGLAQVRERLSTQYGTAAQLSLGSASATQVGRLPLQAVLIRIDRTALHRG